MWILGLGIGLPGAAVEDGRATSMPKSTEILAEMAKGLLLCDLATRLEGVHVGAGARLRRCIVDKNVVVPDWARIGLAPEQDAERYTVSPSGVVVVEKGRAIDR